MSNDGRAAGAVSKKRYAEHRGCSQAYISKLIRLGKLEAPALLPDGRINVALADQMMGTEPDAAEATAGGPRYAQERARREAAQAERAEIELRQLKGELIERSAVAQTLGPWLRQLRDDVLGVPRDTVLDPLSAADCEAGLVAVFAAFSAKLDGLATG